VLALKIQIFQIQITIWKS